MIFSGGGGYPNPANVFEYAYVPYFSTLTPPCLNHNCKFNNILNQIHRQDHQKSDFDLEKLVSWKISPKVQVKNYILKWELRKCSSSFLKLIVLSLSTKIYWNFITVVFIERCSNKPIILSKNIRKIFIWFFI